MRAGRGSSEAYLEDWRRSTRGPAATTCRPKPQPPRRISSPIHGRRSRAPDPRQGHRRAACEYAATGKHMTETVISSASREVVIGFDRPFVIIGERINPTGRKLLAAEMAAGDFSRVEADARAQVAAGAHMLDVNAGIPLADELAIPPARSSSCSRSPMCRCRSTHRSSPCCRRARRVPGQAPRELGHRRGGSPRIRPAARKEVRCGRRRDIERRDGHFRGSGRALRGRAQDRASRDGSRNPGLRRRRRSARHADRRDQPGRRPGHAPRAAPQGRTQGQHDQGIERELGLPNRDGINGAFLTMAIAAGLTSAITNPLHGDVIRSCMAADVMMGHDPDCASWIRRFRVIGSGRHRVGNRGCGRGPARASRRRSPPSTGYAGLSEAS